jgi:hypothetical protein
MRIIDFPNILVVGPPTAALNLTHDNLGLPFHGTFCSTQALLGILVAKTLNSPRERTQQVQVSLFA